MTSEADTADKSSTDSQSTADALDAGADTIIEADITAVLTIKLPTGAFEDDIADADIPRETFLKKTARHIAKRRTADRFQTSVSGLMDDIIVSDLGACQMLHDGERVTGRKYRAVITTEV